MRHSCLPRIQIFLKFSIIVGKSLPKHHFQNSLQAYSRLNNALFPPEDICILISMVCEFSLDGKKEFFKCHQFKDLEMEDYPGLPAWALSWQNTQSHVLSWEGDRYGKDRWEEGLWPQRQTWEWCGHKPRNARSHQQLKEVNGMPQSFHVGAQVCQCLDFSPKELV